MCHKNKPFFYFNSFRNKAIYSLCTSPVHMKRLLYKIPINSISQCVPMPKNPISLSHSFPLGYVSFYSHFLHKFLFMETQYLSEYFFTSAMSSVSPHSNESRIWGWKIDMLFVRFIFLAYECSSVAQSFANQSSRRASEEFFCILSKTNISIKQYMVCRKQYITHSRDWPPSLSATWILSVSSLSRDNDDDADNNNVCFHSGGSWSYGKGRYFCITCGYANR